MKRQARVLVAGAVVASIALIGPIVVSAQGGGEGVVRSDVGPPVPGQTSGVNGYKVFGPNAFGEAPAQAINPTLASPETITAPMRYWSTDAYLAGGSAKGSHTSQSDLNEQEVWVDGAIRHSSASWVDSCRDHAAGFFAHCDTTMLTYEFQTYVGHGWHHFHKSGYIDSDAQTEDRVST
jgi:hypothetical protein